MVRIRPGDRGRARHRSRPSATDDDRGIPQTGATAGVLRALARQVGAVRAAGHARLAIDVERRVEHDPGVNGIARLNWTAMTVADYTRLLRKRWRIVVLCALVAVGAAAAIVWQTTPKYEASTQLFVAAKDTGGSSSGLQSGDQFSQDRVKSYADIIDSPMVTGPVASQVGDGLTATQLANEVSAD